MTEAEEAEEAAIEESDAFASAVRKAVRPLVVGLAILLALVTVAGVIAVGALVVQAKSIIHTRADGTVRTCGSDQYFEIHHNALAGTNQQVTTKVYGDFSRRLGPNEAKAVRDYAAAISVEFEKTKVPVRGCSGEAIAAYIKWRTEHPTAVKCATDSHGYCKVPPTATP